MNPRLAAALAEAFGSEVDSDCVIHLVQEDDGQLLHDPIPGHLFVLRNTSSRFRAELDENWRHTKVARTEGLPSATDARRTFVISLSNAADVESAKAALAFAYSGRVAASNVLEALKIRRQGSLHAIEGLPHACTQAIKQMVIEGGAEGSSSSGNQAGSGASGSDAAHTSATVSQLAVFQLFNNVDLWDRCEDHAEFDAVVSAAKSKLVQYFKDAVAVLNKVSLRQQFLQLGTEGVEALLEADDFGTDDESSVLLMLATWMKKNFEKTDGPARQRLCRCLRLAHLSRPYMFGILPSLALDHSLAPHRPAGWLPLSVMEAAFVASYATAHRPLKGRIRGAFPLQAGDLVSSIYTAKSRRQCIPEGGLAFHWNITEEQLTRSLEGLQPGHSKDVLASFEGSGKSVAAAGFDWEVGLKVTAGADAVRLQYRCRMPSAYHLEGSQRSDQGGKLRVVASLTAKVIVNSWQDGLLESVSRTTQSQAIVDGCYLSWDHVLQLCSQPDSSGVEHGTASTPSRPLAAWSKYLRDGKVTGLLKLLPPLE